MDDLNQTVVIDAGWTPMDYAGLYPKGARDKDRYVSPAPPPLIKQIKGHWPYLFKRAFARYPWQFWVEIIAYRLSEIIGINVPPAFLGRVDPVGDANDARPAYGALIEWFYNPGRDRYIEGVDIMQDSIPEFDRKKGTQHNLTDILEHKIFRSIPNIYQYWAEVLTFDTLIGNVDRHQENWGVIRTPHQIQITVKNATLTKGSARVSFKLMTRCSPAFDNGTALGHEILESKIADYQGERLMRYLTHRRARHHMNWSYPPQPGEEDLDFYEFVTKYAQTYPQTRSAIENMLNFTEDEVVAALAPLVTLSENERALATEERLTEKRIRFIGRLTAGRRDLLRRALGI